MSGAPLVSVVLPVRNGEDYLAEALDSVLAQSGVEFETVVVDDGSSDATPRILAERARPGLIVVQGGGAGLVAALNAGVCAANGKYIARMDADDVALPSRLAMQSALLESDPGCVLVHGSVEIIDGQGNLRGVQRAGTLDAAARIDQLLDRGPAKPIVHPSVMMCTDALRAAGLYRDCPYAEDHELWFRLLEHGTFRAIEEPLLRYRQHAGGISRRKAREQRVTHAVNSAAYLWQRETGIDLYAEDRATYAALRARAEAELEDKFAALLAGGALNEALRRRHLPAIARAALPLLRHPWLLRRGTAARTSQQVQAALVEWLRREAPRSLDKPV